MISMVSTQRERLLTQSALYRELLEYCGVEAFTEVHSNADRLLEINLTLHGGDLKLGLELF